MRIIFIRLGVNLQLELQYKMLNNDKIKVFFCECQQEPIVCHHHVIYGRMRKAWN
jgi:hypothetical protein